MIKKLTKANISLLIIALCAVLFCTIFALNNLRLNRSPVAPHAEETSATLKGKIYVSQSSYNGSCWYETLEYDITNLVITNNYEVPSEPLQKVDVSANSDGTLYAYVEQNAESTYDCTIYADVTTIYAPDCAALLFYGGTSDARTKLYTLQTITFECFDTSEVMDMRNMFNSLENLTSLNLDNFNTSSVTDMNGMFCDCSLLTDLNLSSFETSQVTDMFQMFCGCINLKTLNLSHFNTAKVTNMSQMFSGCKSLSEIKLNNWNTSEVTDIGEMFADCFSLTSLDLSGWNTDKVMNMSAMFLSGNFQTFAMMFGLDINSSTFYTDLYSIVSEGQVWDGTQEDCKIFLEQNMDLTDDELSLKYLDISNFTISSETAIDMMLISLTSLETLILPKQCEATIDLPKIMYQENSENQFTTLISATSDFKALVSQKNTPASKEESGANTPITGFVDEQLLPTIAIGVLSFIAVSLIIVQNKKRKNLI